MLALADNIAIAIENARLFGQERLAKEKALREQAEARQIPRALLPEREPVISGYAIDGFCLQLSAVGGDWYDYVELGDGFWGIALGDVCGKGMAAALLMSATRSLFRRAAEANAMRPRAHPSAKVTKRDAYIRESEFYVRSKTPIEMAEQRIRRAAPAGFSSFASRGSVIASSWLRSEFSRRLLY